MRYLLGLCLLLIGCNESRGSLTKSLPLEDVSSCPPDREVIHKMITTDINWDTMSVSNDFSWQCTKKGTSDDTYRVHVDIN